MALWARISSGGYVYRCFDYFRLLASGLTCIQHTSCFRHYVAPFVALSAKRMIKPSVYIRITDNFNELPLFDAISPSDLFDTILHLYNTTSFYCSIFSGNTGSLAKQTVLGNFKIHLEIEVTNYLLQNCQFSMFITV